MAKKLTITVSEEVYEGLHRVIGPRKISRFLESVARPYLIDPEIRRAYEEMAADEAREAEALEWSEGLIRDAGHDPRICKQR
jgi:hypothetical protein